MLTNKDIRVENGNIVINGDKYPLDGQSPATIMEIVSENSDTTPTENSDAPITSGGVFAADKDISDTIGDITQTGFTGSTVAAQLGNIKSREGMRVLSTSAHPIDVSFTNGVGTINLLDIDSNAMEIVSLFCWGQNVSLSFSLSNWTTKTFTINDLTSPTYTGTLAIEVIYSVYYEV